MKRHKLIIEYDGGPFMGWQRQPHGMTVQEAIETAINAITGETVAVHGAGRTDTGVHARAMAAHVDIQKSMPPYRLVEGINAMLRPHPIAILSAEIVADDWHARFSSTGRRYLYRIINRRSPLTIDKGKAWRVSTALNADAMHAAAQRLVGRHDFTTFRSVHCQSASPVKTLESLSVERLGDEIIIKAAARSFLHHQVRSMVGCLEFVGEEKWSADDLQGALEAKDRAALGYNAPPDGLYFMESSYP